jgi:hypothetical protein
MHVGSSMKLPRVTWPIKNICDINVRQIYSLTLLLQVHLSYDYNISFKGGGGGGGGGGCTKKEN